MENVNLQDLTRRKNVPPIYFRLEFQETSRDFGFAKACPKKFNSIVDDILEPISGARTSTGLCNINIYDSFTKLI